MAKWLGLLIAAALALVPAVAGAAPNSSGVPQCTPKMLPFPATYYPRVVAIGDSIFQREFQSGVANSASNPSITPSVTTTAGNAVIAYNGTDTATLGLYYGQGISGTGIAAGSTVVGAVDATHIRLSAAATASGTVNATITTPINTAAASWTMVEEAYSEIGDAQKLFPYFRLDQWNDTSRNFAVPAASVPPPFMRGSDMAYFAGLAVDVRQHLGEVKRLNPDILILAIGTNNNGLGLGPAQAALPGDIADVVDTMHAWCPSLPIILGNIRPVSSVIAAQRFPGAAIYDNALIAGIAATRPWIHTVDLWTPLATNPASGGSLTATGATTLNSAVVTVSLSYTLAAGQLGIQVGQTVTGSYIPASTTVTAVGTNTITLSNNATGTQTGTVLTFSPLYNANQTGLATSYADGLHPSNAGAWLEMPGVASAICQFIAGNCAISTTHNIYLDNPGQSILTTNPSSLLTDTAVASYSTGTGGQLTSLTGTWVSGASSITTSAAPTGAYVGECVTGTGLGTQAYVTSISGTTVGVAPVTAASETAQAISFVPCVHGQSPLGIGGAVGSASNYSSYLSTIAANAETGGKMLQFTLYPAGSNTSEDLAITGSLTATGCAAKWCQMWGEFEVDQNAGWSYIEANAQERNSAIYSIYYYSQGNVPILPYGTGTRRIWAATPCFPYPANTTGIKPQFYIYWNPSSAAGTNPQINFRRWDIRKCDPPQDRYRGR